MQASNLALLRRLLKGQKRSDGLLEDERNNQNQNRENHPGVSENHFFRARKWGNSNTSRILGLSVKSITSRSTPVPKPPLGGMP